MAKKRAHDPYPWLLRSVAWGVWVKLVVACGVLAPTLPLILAQMAGSLLWHGANELAGGVMGVSWTLDALGGRMHRAGLLGHPADVTYAGWLMWLVVGVPGLFAWVLYKAMTETATPWVWIAVYSQLRLGPIYAGFMWMYVLCHKEAHCKGRVVRWMGARQLYVCNYWAGLFHGVLPGVFNVSHVRNHHRYENAARDLHCTAYLRRDRVSSLLVYLVDWLAYASNVSGLAAFAAERNWHAVRELALGTALYLAFAGIVLWMDVWVGLLCVVYPFFEANVLLSCVNYVWHAFIDADRLYDDRISSTTVVEGMQFVLGEEFHVVHHIMPGVHWTRHAEIFWNTVRTQAENDKEQRLLTVFYKANLFEILYLIVTGDVKGLADRLYKPLVPTLWARARIEATLKARLQTAGADVAAALERRPDAAQQRPVQ